MNRTSNDIRQVFLRLHKSGKSVIEISQILGVSRQTIYDWIKQSESKLLKVPNPNTQKPTPKLSELDAYIKKHPFAFNKEIAQALQMSRSAVQRWRKKLGYSRKKAKTTYKESNPELKKTLSITWKYSKPFMD